MNGASEGVIRPDHEFDLEATLESGQTFQWRRWPGDGEMFDGESNARYYTVIPPNGSSDAPDVLQVVQQDQNLHWASTLADSIDAEFIIKARLGLDVSLSDVKQTFPSDDLLTAALDAHSGLRVPQDPAFPTLISFICSAAMRVERIHEMQRRIADAFGQTVRVDGHEFAAFPTPTELAEVPEAELRELKLGYRAEYVHRTALMVAQDQDEFWDTTKMAYEDARSNLLQYVGVGEKVADCTLLFGFGFLEAVPIDTWVNNALEDHYPHLNRSSYSETSRELREYFGPYAGYAQAYIFHYLRSQ